MADSPADARSVVYELSVRVDYTSITDFLVDYIKNLIGDGIFIPTDDPLPEGATVNVVLTFPDGGTLSARGTVKHSTQLGQAESAELGYRIPGMAVRFPHLVDHDVRLRRLLDRVAAKKRVTLKEQRRQHRHEGTLVIGFQGGGEFLWEFSKNISAGGVFVKTFHPLPLYSRIGLKIVLPDGEVADVAGEVVHIVSPEDRRGDPGMGIQFVDLEVETQEKIQTYIGSLAGGKEPS